MPEYMLTVRLLCNDNDELVDRLQTWGFHEGEGVMSAGQHPDPVVLPPNLQAGAAPPSQ
jgi:hypothetical protein